MVVSMPSKFTAEQPGILKETSLRDFLITTFLHQDGHSDVYALKETSDTSITYQGYLFLHDEIPGTRGKYRKRRLERLQRSRGFIGETTLKGRSLLVTSTVSDEKARIRKSDADFPPLRSLGERLLTRTKRRRRHALYAAVICRDIQSKAQEKEKEKEDNLKHRSGNPSKDYIAYWAWENREKAHQEIKWKEQNPHGAISGMEGPWQLAVHEKVSKSKETRCCTRRTMRGTHELRSKGGFFRERRILKADRLQSRSSDLASVNPFMLLSEKRREKGDKGN